MQNLNIFIALIRIFAGFRRILLQLRQSRRRQKEKSSLKNTKTRQFISNLLIFSKSSSFGLASRTKTDDVVELEKLAN